MISRKAYLMRIYRGWNPEEAANTPKMTHYERGMKGARKVMANPNHPWRKKGKRAKSAGGEEGNAKT